MVTNTRGIAKQIARKKARRDAVKKGPKREGAGSAVMRGLKDGAKTVVRVVTRKKPKATSYKKKYTKKAK